MFKVDAHKWIDRVSKLGRDAIVSESLDSASRGAGECTVIHKTLQDRFRALIPDLATGGIDDARRHRQQGAGRSRASATTTRSTATTSAAPRSWPTRCAAICPTTSGARAASSMRVAAAPVLSKGRDRIVGAHLRRRRDRRRPRRAPQEEPRRRRRAAPARQVDRHARATPASLAPLPDLVEQHAQEIAEVKRTPAHPAHRRQRQTARGRGAVPRPGGPAAGLLRAARHAAGEADLRGAADAHQLRRSQVGATSPGSRSRGGVFVMIARRPARCSGARSRPRSRAARRAAAAGARRDLTRSRTASYGGQVRRPGARRQRGDRALHPRARARRRRWPART